MKNKSFMNLIVLLSIATIWLKNLKIFNKNLISKLFVRHFSGNKRQNEEKKNSIDFLIKLNKVDFFPLFQGLSPKKCRTKSVE